MPKDSYSAAKHLLSSAISAEDRQNYAEARRLYLDAIVLFDKVVCSSKDATVQGRSKEFKDSAYQRVKFIDEHYQKQLAASSTEKKPSRTLPSKDTILRKVKNVSSSAVTRILNEVVEDCSSVTLADVAGNDRAKQLLTEAVILPTLRPELFTGLREPVRGVLLFGPPGNGKTMLAKAVSSESNCIFFNISAASLLSKWVGESENTVKALFAVAREVSPSIIFLDEVDSLLAARRADGGHEVSRRVLTQILAEMDGVQSGSERVLVLAATNRPQELDDAALRRFPRRVYVRMPDMRTRQEMLLKLLGKNVNHSLSRTDVERIARGTEGFSASDLKELAKEAALQPIREISTTQLRTISEHEVRPLALKDFIQSLKFVRPSVSGTSLAPYESWNKQFGESNEPVVASQVASSTGVGKRLLGLM